MDSRFEELLEETFSPGEFEGEDKVISLEEAVRRHVRPGMTIHMCREANATCSEIMRQFHGKKPGFTFVLGAANNYVLNLIHANLATKLIFGVATRMHAAGPVPALQLAHQQKRVEIENWSLLTLQQRLMAASMGVAFMPTRSLLGTGLAKDNAAAFQQIDDPFGSGQKVGAVKALDVDLSIIHGCVADRYGNTLVGAPYEDTTWGPKASKNGVLVTVEKIVPTSFIREHAGLVRLPGYMVASVSVVPFGAHPFGLVNPGIKGYDGYVADQDFIASCKASIENPDLLDAWIREWMLDCGSQQGYLHKLGEDRLRKLKEKSAPGYWLQELKSISAPLSEDEAFTTNESMIVIGARKIKETIKKRGYRTLLAGMGAAGLSAWLAQIWLRKEGYGLDLIVGSGQMGYTPLPTTSVMQNSSQVYTCKMFTDIAESYYTVVGGQNNKCMAVLGAAQIDKNGNINMSWVGGRLFTGPGGAADSVNSREVLVIARQSKNRFLETVPYISVVGDRTKTLVTNLGIFEKLDGETSFTLVSLLPALKSFPVKDRLDEVAAKCGWGLKVAQNLEELSRPTMDELITLRLLDPARNHIGD